MPTDTLKEITPLADKKAGGKMNDCITEIIILIVAAAIAIFGPPSDPGGIQYETQKAFNIP